MQLKSLLRFPVDIRRARRILEQSAADMPQLNRPPVVLDLRTPQMLFDCGRHFASIAHHARDAGSRFYVRCSPMMLSGIARKIHGREMLGEDHTGWIPLRQPLPRQAVVLTDHDEVPNGAYRMLIGRDIDRRLPVMPYPMHPATLRQLEHTDLPELREHAQRRGIFFAGNQKAKYGADKLMRNFGMLSRLEILGLLAEKFPTRIEASMSADVDESSIVISDSRLESIDACDWLPTLAKAQFFICCPGSSQPMCHNLIEAMSVGTIPILEYGDRVTPMLQDGENAICFHGRRGLLEAIDRIDQLDPQQITRLRHNVADFYDQNLCGTRFLASLRDGAFESSKICMPFHECNFYPSNRSVAA